ncbi:hypothetical protein, partial [Janthinobacterium sp. GMG1]|uniref:hypothetical protein n=1 Tax=Janthinobacterium sp. GMG1 TaxID=3096007 RepID=UPI002ACA17DB
VQVHVPSGVGVRVPSWAPLPNSQKGRKLSRVCGFFHFRSKKPPPRSQQAAYPAHLRTETRKKPLKKEADSAFFHRRQPFSGEKTCFLKKSAKC